MPPSRPGELFQPDRSRLYPRFETYRLHSLDPDSDVRGFKLPGSGATQSRVGYGEQQLGFKEVRARIAWDHLDAAGARGAYVDKDWNVVGFELGDDLAPRFATLAALPTPIISVQAEYPRALPLSGTAWAVSSGSGSLYILRVSPPGGELAGSFVARYDLGEGGGTPFALHAAHQDSGDVFRLLLTRPVVETTDNESRFKPRTASFELLEVEVDVSRSNQIDDGPEQLVPRWSLTGGDLPYWTVWAEGGWVVLSEEPFENTKGQEREEETAAARAERQHRERVGKLGLGASLPPGEEQPPTKNEGDDDDAMDVDEPKEYPFRWTQSNSVTITLSLPATTTSKDIKVKITPQLLFLSIASDSLSPTLATFLSKPAHSFWAGVDAEKSTWRYDPATGVLEVDLAKREEDSTRWPSVFVPGSDDDEDDDEDVPETFAPATLAAFRESFSQVRTRATTDEPQGNHPAIPALLREEMDFDLEDGADYGEYADGEFAEISENKVGRTVFFGFIESSAEDGVRATWSRQSAAVLSLPIDTAGDLPRNTGVMIKTAVDGLLFVPTTDPRAPWTHLGTNPALAFVMSSKRDLRLVRHVTTTTTTPGFAPAPAATGTGPPGEPTGEAATTVLAFDSGSGAGHGNAYVYYPPVRASDDTVAQQGVVSVSGGDGRGALLGVGSVQVAGALSGGGGEDRCRKVVVALCEHELVVLAGVV